MMRHGAIRATMPSGALGAAAAAAAVFALAACSAPKPHPHSAPRAATTASPRAEATRTAAPGTEHPVGGTSTGQLGSALAVSDSSGTRLDVTLKQVIDPASGASQYAKPASGSHFVGIKLHIQNTATTSYQNNANNETTIVLSDGKTVHADYNPIAGCGNFDHGQATLKGGAASTGCVTFQVPKGQKVIRVGYGNTVFPGKTAEWHVS